MKGAALMDWDELHDAGVIQLRALWEERRRAAVVGGGVGNDGVGNGGCRSPFLIPVRTGGGMASIDGGDAKESELAPSSLDRAGGSTEIAVERNFSACHGESLEIDNTNVMLVEGRKQNLNGMVSNSGLETGAARICEGQHIAEVLCTSGVRSYSQVLQNTQNISPAAHGARPPLVGQFDNGWKRPNAVALPARADLGSFSIDGKSIQLDEGMLEANTKRFEAALVGRLFGKRLPFLYLRNELNRRWERFGSFRIVTITADCFICFFENVGARNAVLMEGPWKVAGQVIGLDRWSPNFSPTSFDGLCTPVWVRLPGLPLVCWDKINIARIIAFLGEPLWVDAATENMERASYARACVNLDLSKPLPSGVRVHCSRGNFFQTVEYEGLTKLCFNCGQVGHTMTTCNAPQLVSDRPPVGHSEPVGSQSARASSSAQGGSTVAPNPSPDLDCLGGLGAQNLPGGENVGLGPWMLVSRRKRHSRSTREKTNFGGKGSNANKSGIVIDLVQTPLIHPVPNAPSSPPRSGPVIGSLLGDVCVQVHGTSAGQTASSLQVIGENPAVEPETVSKLDSDLDAATHDVHRSKSSIDRDLVWGDFTPVAGKKAKKKKKKKLMASQRVTRSQVKKNFLPGALPPETPAGGAAPLTPPDPTCQVDHRQGGFPPGYPPFSFMERSSVDTSALYK